ncbi:acetolactate synthase small subunit [Mariprofundus ferrooxydans]|uniref:Acetolactate synthase small subunit n=1 Tax=Mariprofundus ferrooxydans PV-1 TaxID=314345 RepID=Q0F0X2_9PROT|nr:acetolactate synthase small subunit [Mariprofundus ferrooxydans]EAU55419.1 Acetolactate synthase, small subunit [Mariprofundus ferrooxydans PV-1]KON47667.1 acetolactate synthase [Mariprofundus ferrooxydans]
MRHTITVLVENEFGVLTRVAGLFSARGYNIESLNVAPIQDKTVSRMTIVTRGDERAIEQIKKQLNKLIPVIKVDDISHTVHLEREMLLVKVAASPESYNALLELADSFGAKVVDDHIDSHMILELTGKAQQLDEFLSRLSDFDVTAMTRTGPVGMRRDAKGFNLD